LSDDSNNRTLTFLGRMDRLGRGLENVFLVGLLGAMMVLSVMQIIMREVFNTGVVWAGELLKLMVLWLAMIAAIAACRDNRRIRIDALSHVLPKQAIRYTRVLVDLFAAAVCGVVAWHAWRYLQLEIEFEDTVLIDTPAWIVHAIIPVSFAVTGYRFVVGAVRKALGRDDDKEQGVVL
jgi:TRAP-type C4-dicarboxylate transport system permease small subunit